MRHHRLAMLQTEMFFMKYIILTLDYNSKPKNRLIKWTAKFSLSIYIYTHTFFFFFPFFSLLLSLGVGWNSPYPPPRSTLDSNKSNFPQEHQRDKFFSFLIWSATTVSHQNNLVWNYHFNFLIIQSIPREIPFYS